MCSKAKCNTRKILKRKIPEMDAIYKTIRTCWYMIKSASLKPHFLVHTTIFAFDIASLTS